MTATTIRELTVPAAWDDDTDDGRVFRERVRLNQTHSDARYGEGLFVIGPQESLAGSRSTASEARIHLGAFDGDRLVGLGGIWLPLAESTDVIDFGTVAAPDLPLETQREVHELLVADVEARARDLGRTTFMGGSNAAETGEVTARTGFGGASSNDPEAAPLIERGYSLEQVYRVSLVDLRDLPDLDVRLATAGERSVGYEVLSWSGVTPPEHREGMLSLHAAMSTDAPVGDLALEPEVWTDDRLAEFEQWQLDGGRVILTVAARHVATGELAGFSTLFVPPTGDAARQHDTLVASAHRGHRLGMLLKLANLAALRDGHPSFPRVTTWNAEENRPMLSVNEQVGFVPVGYEGVWQLRTSSEAEEEAA